MCQAAGSRFCPLCLGTDWPGPTAGPGEGNILQRWLSNSSQISDQKTVTEAVLPTGSGGCWGKVPLASAVKWSAASVMLNGGAPWHKTVQQADWGKCCSKPRTELMIAAAFLQLAAAFSSTDRLAPVTGRNTAEEAKQKQFCPTNQFLWTSHCLYIEGWRAFWNSTTLGSVFCHRVWQKKDWAAAKLLIAHELLRPLQTILGWPPTLKQRGRERILISLFSGRSVWKV